MSYQAKQRFIDGKKARLRGPAFFISVVVGLQKPDDFISCFLCFEYRFLIVEYCSLLISGSLDRPKRGELMRAEKPLNRLDCAISTFLGLNCHRDAFSSCKFPVMIE